MADATNDTQTLSQRHGESPQPWRVGRKVGRTIYDADDRLIGVMDTVEDAQHVVAALADAARLRETLERIADAAYSADADVPRNEHGTPVWDIGDGAPGVVITVADFSHAEDFASFMADVARTDLAKIARDALRADTDGDTN